MNEMTIRYAEKIDSCRILGPGNRAVLWVHGCCFDCPGCIAQSFRHGPYRELTPAQAADWVLNIPDLDGLTISGGEPMLQAAALVDMVDRIRARRDMGLIVYTGFRHEELLDRHQPEIDRFLGQIDLLIDGRYERDLDFNQPYRGSENQRLLLLTDRYHTDLTDYYGAAQGRSIELRFTGTRMLMVGVPGKDQVAVWDKLKKEG